jgi:methionyl-tRNA synthetase
MTHEANGPEIGVPPAVPPAPVAPAPVVAAVPVVSVDEFKKFKFAVAQIKEVAVHPNADKLFVVKVDLGGEIRQMVAGIRLSYTPEQLVGRRVIVITNLQPAVIRGVESQGMILAASDAQGISVLQPDRDVVLGSGVK